MLVELQRRRLGESQPMLSREVGVHHPLRRWIGWWRVLGRDLAMAASLVPAIAILAALLGAASPGALIATLSVMSLLATAAAITGVVCRELAIAHFASGRRPGAPFLQTIAGRLVRGSSRLQRAQTLERALSEARDLERVPVGKRPPPAARRLVARPQEIEIIVAALRAGSSASLQVIALCWQLTVGGYGSSLCTMPLPALHQELRQICHLLQRFGSDV
jgi:hypothetical protein